MNYTSHYNSPLGSITLASNDNALIGLWFGGQKHFGSTLGDEYEEKPLPVFDRTAAWLDIYFGGGIPDFTPKIALNDTNFRREVWDILHLSITISGIISIVLCSLSTFNIPNSSISCKDRYSRYESFLMICSRNEKRCLMSGSQTITGRFSQPYLKCVSVQ